MYLNKLLLKDFGKFNNKEIELKPGVNVVCGERKSGKTTVRDFVTGIFYGIDKSKRPGKRESVYQLRKPNDGRGFTGKAYIKKDDASYLVERNFAQNGRKLSVLDINNGRDVRVGKDNSLQGTLTDMDRSVFEDGLCIGRYKATTSAELAEEMNSYLYNMTSTGISGLDKQSAIKRLKSKRNQFDVRPLERKLVEISSEIDVYKEVDGNLEEVRQQIAKLDEEYAMEVAKRKREARRLIEIKQATEGEEGSESSEDGSSDSRRVFLDADLMKDYKPEVKLTDRIWFICLTGLFVVAVIAAMVYILPFEKGVRQLFIVCTILFVIVTIVEGLYSKGYFSDEIKTPSDEEFRRMIHELERKTEAYEDVEIDMSFATEFTEKKEQLQILEKKYLDIKERKKQLEDERQALIFKSQDVEREIHAINLAINTINEISTQIHNEHGNIIDGNIAPIISTMTDGRYINAYLDDTYGVMVKDGESYVRAEKIAFEHLIKIYLAVRICVAKVLMRDRMPIIFDGILDSYGPQDIKHVFECLKDIESDQTIITTARMNSDDFFLKNGCTIVKL